MYKILGIILSITLISNQNIYLNNNSLNTSTIFQQERILTNIFANFTRSQKKEMLAFDIDGTLLNGTETLSENHPQTLTQLVNLLKSGANIIFITLSDYEQKHNRSTITPILNYLKSQNLTHLMKNITIYARSGAIKYTFTETGQEISEILDYDFSLIDAGIIQDIIKKLAKHKFNLTKKEQELWIRYYSNPIEGKKYNALWLDDINTFSKSDLVINGDYTNSKNPVPYIFYQPNTQLGIRVLPYPRKEEFKRKYKYCSQFTDEEIEIIIRSSQKVRKLITKKIKKRLDKKYKNLFYHYVSGTGMGIFLMDKKTIMKKHLKSLDYDLNKIIYLGDEFAKDGADESMLEIEGLLCINVGEEKTKALDIHGGPKQTAELLGYIYNIIKIYKKLKSILYKEKISKHSILQLLKLSKHPKYNSINFSILQNLLSCI